MTKICSEKITPMSEYMDVVLAQFRRMEELAFVSAYGKESVPEITQHLELVPGDGYDVVHHKYAYATVLLSDLLHRMGCWKNTPRIV